MGGVRHLELLPPAAGQRRLTWPSNLRQDRPALLSDHNEQHTVALASGDPLVAGIGSTLIEIFGAEQVRIHPAVSSVALARARMGWSEDSVEVIRLRSDDVDQVRRWLFSGQRLVILSRDGDSPAEIAAMLAEAGCGDSLLTVLGDLGSTAESRQDDPQAAPALNVVCVEVRGEPRWASLAPGLPDDAYEHDGQLTKRDVRASAMARLEPRPGEMLWDIGAGSGSIAIEWLRASPRAQAIAIERDHDRAKRIAANASQLGVPGLQVVHGVAAAALADLPGPDAVFVGGGATTAILDLVWSALRTGGRLVVHAVTVETEMIIIGCWQRLGGEVTRIAVEHLEQIGSYSGWKPSRAVVQWSVVKR